MLVLCNANFVVFSWLTTDEMRKWETTIPACPIPHHPSHTCTVLHAPANTATMHSLRHLMVKSPHNHRRDASTGDIVQEDGDRSPRTDVEIETPKDTNRSRRDFFDSKHNEKTTSTVDNDLGTRSPGNGRVNGDDVGTNRERVGANKLLSATSAALTRFKGVTLRPGTSGRMLNPRSATLGSSLSSPFPSRTKRGSHASPLPSPPRQTSLHTSSNTGSKDYSREASASEGDGDNISVSGSVTERNTHRNKLSVIFDDDEEGDNDARNGAGEGNSGDGPTPSDEQEEQEHTDSTRSKWASTLMASTLAREKSTRRPSTAVRVRVDLLPRPRDASNKVPEHRMSVASRVKLGSRQTAR